MTGQPARSPLLLTLLLLVAAAALAPPADANTPRNPDDPGWCRVCHREAVFMAEPVSPWAHADVGCRECHQDYQFDPHEEVADAEGEAIDALTARGVDKPGAMASCFDCHDAVDAENPARLPHGKDKLGLGKGLPFCLDCHGNPHIIRLESSLPKIERRRAMNRRCATCHANAVRMAAGVTGIDSPGNRVHPAEFSDGKSLEGGGHGSHASEHATGLMGAYRDTVHGRKLRLGSATSPGCVDCHGGHETWVPSQSKDSQPCKACHKDAGPSFKSLAIHKPLTQEGKPVGYWTLKFFAWLTFLTILALSVHVLLDVYATLRTAMQKTGAPKPSYDEREHEETVLRFDVQQRISHLLMIVSFTLLVLTGWPLSASGVGASQALMDFFGGADGCGLVHRIAGIGLAVCSLHHLLYLLVQATRGKMRWSMVPLPRDIRDVVHNLMYFIGLRKERPRFARFSYFEKFDYWAVFWGSPILISSGLMRWFPEITAEYLPTWAYDIAYVAHADEALLAALAIFVWHFYNVHLRPAVFPMSWVFITGRMTLHELDEEHGEVYDALKKESAAAAENKPAENKGGEA